MTTKQNGSYTWGRGNPFGGRKLTDGHVDPLLAELAHIAAVDAARRDTRPASLVSCRRCGSVPRPSKTGPQARGWGFTELSDGTWTCRRYPRCEPLYGGLEWSD